MNARLKHKFNKGFLLTEENLIKIEDLIKKRLLEKDFNSELIFKVYRNDGMFIKYNDSKSVLEEENSNRNKIMELQISSKAEDCLVELSFDSYDGAKLVVDSNNRDLAYLLSSDIKEYISSEVIQFKMFNFSLIDALPYLVLLFPILIMINMLFFDKVNVLDVLSSTDINEKLNFLIMQEEKKRDWEPILIYFLPVLIVFLFSFLFFKLFPKNIFYWGKSCKKYDDILKLRSNLLWGVIVSGGVALFITYIWDYIKA